MSLILNPTSGVAYLETEEAVPWASLGGRAYTHFILLETTESKGVSQYVWSTGNYLAANALNMYFASPGLLYVSAGPSSGEVPATATSPAFGGGLLRLAAIRGIGVENSNSAVDFQTINLGTLPGSSSVQISSSTIIKYTTGGSDSFAARKLTLGDRQTTPGDRKFFGTMHFAGSVNRALDDNELIAILTGDIQVLDYFKQNLVELWDFQRGDASALTGLISGTTLKMFGGSNLTWTPDAPLPVSKTRGHTILGATNRSILTPVWTFGESSGGSETINCTAADLALSGHGAGLVELSVIECSAGAVSVGGELCAVYQAQAISCSAAALTLTAPAAQQIESGDSVISCSTAALALVAAAAQQLEAGDSVIGCSTAPLALSAAAAQQVEVGDSVIGCVSAALTLTTPSAQQLESGDSVVGCTAAALAVSAPAAQQVEVGDSVVGCTAAALAVSAPAAQQLEVGDSVIGCAATIVSLDGTTATITDSMGVRSAAVVLSTPGCSIHDFDIIGAGQAALVTGSSAAALVESGEAIIDTGYADIGIAAAQCGIVQTDAEPIITDIGLVASINQPTIYATIPRRTTTARV